MKTFTFKGIKYRTNLRRIKSNSNYDYFAHLFKKGNKTPIMGFSCKRNTNIDEIIEQFKRSLNHFDL